MTASALERNIEILRRNLSYIGPFVRHQDISALLSSQGNPAPRFDEQTVMHCDIKGFTALTETLSKNPEGLEKITEIMNELFSELVGIVKYYGGQLHQARGR